MKTIDDHLAPAVARRLASMAIRLAIGLAIGLMPTDAQGQTGGEAANANAANANVADANAANANTANANTANANTGQSDTPPADKQEASANSNAKESAPADQAAGAQPPAQAPATNPVEATDIPSDLSTTAIQGHIDQVQVATDIEEVTKVEVVNAYKQALEQIKVIDSWQQKIQQYEQGRTQAPADLATAKGLLENVRNAAPVTLTSADLETKTLEELSQELAAAEAKLSSKQAEAKQFDDEAKNRADRRSAISQLLSDATSRLERINRDLNASAPTGVSQRVTQAKKTLLQAQKRATELEIRSLQDETKFYDSRAEILATKQQTARLEVAARQAEVQAYQTAVSARRQAEIDAKKIEAEKALANAPQSVRDLAEENAELVSDRADVAKRIDEATKETTAVNNLIKEWEDQLAAIKKIVDQPGMAKLIGPQMRKYRAQLSDLLTYQVEYRRLQEEKARIDFRNEELDAEIRELEDIEKAFEEEIASIEASTGQPTSDWTKNKVREFLAAKRDAVKALGADYSTLATRMIELVPAIHQLLTKVESDIAFIDTHLLWLRSAAPIHQTHLPDDWPELGTRLSAVGRQLWNDVLRSAAQYAVFLIVFLSLCFTRRSLKRRMDELADLSTKASTDSMAWTLHALGITVLLAAPWPALLAFLAFRLQQAASLADPVTFEWCKAVSQGFFSAAIVTGAQEFLRNMCRRRGVVDDHLRWHGSIVKFVRRTLAAVVIIGAPLAWITATAEQLDDSAWADSVGRIAFLVGMGVLMVTTYLLAAPGGKLMTSLFRKRASGIYYATRYIWFFAAMLTPLVLAFASAWGYHYTATELSARYVGTLLLLILANLVFALISRWVLVQQRTLALEQNRKKLEAKKEAESGKSVDIEPREHDLVNLVSLGSQTKTLLGNLMTFSVVIGLWFIWNDVLPALSFLQDVNLWSYAVETTGANGDAAAVSLEVRYVTLANLLLATVVGIVGYALARNLPGVLEITILQRTKLDAGARFAATALARYFITVIGIFVGFNLLGVQWSDVQWLVAAISVGLGFGLQEIFANFISGLMMLFERPIRVGDTVTVGDVSGTVTHMRIRATTVTDWNRKELIIPNKEFITGQVINWTLSDTVQRIVIPVGIAYGSDTRQAERLLYEVARRHPNVLEDPPPVVYFNNFGDSALSFELRVFISDLALLIETKHALHFAIDDAFRNAQPKPIEIAFPQQDIHIRSIEGRLGIDANRVQQAATAANSDGKGNGDDGVDEVGNSDADEQELDRKHELHQTS